VQPLQRTVTTQDEVIPLHLGYKKRQYREIWISHVGNKIKVFWRIVSCDQYTRTPEGATYFPLLQNVQTGTGAYPASHSMGTGTLSRR